MDAFAPHSNRLNVTRGPEEATVDSFQRFLPKDPGKTVSGERPYHESSYCALQAINLRTPPHFPTLAVTMHTHVPPLRFMLLSSLLCSALSQHLTSTQINIVKQQLQVGATHRSVSYHIPSLSSWWSLGHPSLSCHHYLNPRDF